MVRTGAASMHRWLDRVFTVVEDVIFPQKLVCLNCGCFSQGQALCEDCQTLLDVARLPENEIAPMRQAVWAHRGLPRRMVLRLKHGGTAVCAQVLAEGMAKQLENTLPRETVVTSVPMTEKARQERGIDHGELLAQGVAERLGLPFRPLMRRVRETQNQQRLSAQERRENLKNAFVAIETIDFPVLLVDDVYTTGSTADACTAALMAGGASQVMVIAANQAGRNANDGGVSLSDETAVGEPLLDLDEAW